MFMSDAACSRRYWKHYGVDGSTGAQSNCNSKAGMRQSKRCVEDEETGAVEDDTTSRLICLEDTFGEEESTRSGQSQVTANLGSPTKQEIEVT